MQTRKLGNSDLHITPLGCGAWAIGRLGLAVGVGIAGSQRLRGEGINFWQSCLLTPELCTDSWFTQIPPAESGCCGSPEW